MPIHPNEVTEPNWTPTMHLRFVKKIIAGVEKKVLQQMWVKVSCLDNPPYKTWKDVKLVERESD